MRTAVLLALCTSAVAFLPSPPARRAAGLTRCRADRLSLPGVVRIDEKGAVFLGKASKPIPPPPAEPKPRWSEPIDQFFERIESTKAAVAGLFAGSVASAVPTLLLHLDNIGQAEFNIDQIAIMSALFAIVYRYAVRADGNPQLKQGCVAAFVLTRTLGAVVTPTGTTGPLDAGRPSAPRPDPRPLRCCAARPATGSARSKNENGSRRWSRHSACTAAE